MAPKIVGEETSAKSFWGSGFKNIIFEFELWPFLGQLEVEVIENHGRKKASGTSAHNAEADGLGPVTRLRRDGKSRCLSESVAMKKQLILLASRRIAANQSVPLGLDTSNGVLVSPLVPNGNVCVEIQGHGENRLSSLVSCSRYVALDEQQLFQFIVMF
jgi:hypothetical protein